MKYHAQSTVLVIFCTYSCSTTRSQTSPWNTK